MSRIETNDPRVVYLHDAGFPFVCHGCNEMGIEHAYYDFDNESYAKQAVKYLVRKGRENIGLIAVPDSLSFGKFLNSEFYSELEKHDLLEIPMRNMNIDSSFDEIMLEIGRIMRSIRPLDGVVCSSATSAIELVGLKIGKDVDIVAKDSFGLLNYFRPELFVIPEDFRVSGNHLIKMVQAIIEGDDPKNHQILETPIMSKNMF